MQLWAKQTLHGGVGGSIPHVPEHVLVLPDLLLEPRDHLERGLELRAAGLEHIELLLLRLLLGLAALIVMRKLRVRLGWKGKINKINI
jgi:hypothetical protein